jgi:sulfur-oxidizing protein SoxZ
MSGLTKIRARKTGAATEILVLVKHPMETGWRQDKTSQVPIPAHYIDQISFEFNGKLVAEAHLGPNVDANPLTAIRLENVRSGDKVAVSWIDNWGEGERVETTVR